jgi:ATP-dependent Clp protease ATP-binding subunit ClpC
MTDPLGRDAYLVVLKATREAASHGHSYVGTEHLLLALLADRDSAAVLVLETLGIDVEAVRGQVERIIGSSRQSSSGMIPHHPRTEAVLELARQEAARAGEQVNGVHILLGLIQEGQGAAARVLAEHGADLMRTRRAMGDRPVIQAAVLASFRDLTEAARNDELGLVIGRDREVGRLIRVLSQYFAGSPVLIYEAGADRLSVVARLAQRIAAGDVPVSLQGKRLAAVGLVALAERLPAALSEQVTAMVVAQLGRHADLLFCTDDLRVLTRTSGAGNPSAAAIFKALLADGKMKLIGVMVQAGANESPETTILEKFELIRVSEPITSYDIGMLKQALRDI